MRNKNLILFIFAGIMQVSQAMDLVTAINNKIGYVSPNLNPYDLSQKPEWAWPQTSKSHSGATIHDRAGVLPFAWHNGTVYVLLGYETAKGVWTDFTGSADRTDSSALHTAAREFAEESNIVFYKTAKGKKLTDKYGHKDIQSAIKNILEYKQNITEGPMVRGVSRGLKPFDQWMYFVEVPYIPAQELNKSARGPGSEMGEFRWISIEDLLKILNTAQKFQEVTPFGTNSKPLYKYLLNTLLRSNALLFLRDLYQRQLDLEKKQTPLETLPWTPNLIEALELLHDSLQRLEKIL